MEQLGAEVRRELSRFGPAAGIADLVAAWPAAVGDAIARNAWPLRLGRDGTLHVATESAAWAFELAQLERQLVERLRALAGDAAPRQLRFAVGRLPEPATAPEAAKRRRSKPSAGDRAEGHRLAAEIEDADVREAVAKAVAHALSKGRSGRTL